MLKQRGEWESNKVNIHRDTKGQQAGTTDNPYELEKKIRPSYKTGRRGVIGGRG